MVTLASPEKCERRDINGQAFGGSENFLRFDGHQFILDGYRSTVLLVSSTRHGVDIEITDDDVEQIANLMGLRDCVLMTSTQGHGGIMTEALCRIE